VKKLLLAVFGISSFAFANAQSLQWSTPVELPSGGMYGSTRSRVVVSNGIPVVIWGNELSGEVYASRLVNGAFTNPLQLTPSGLQAFIADWVGPEASVHGDTIFVTFESINSPGPAYTVRSTDGGQTFGDTVSVPMSGSDVARFPNVALLPGGNPIVSRMRFTSSFSEPYFVTNRSTNGGQSYDAPVAATNNITGDACDCCPGGIGTLGNTVAVVYRNNDSNIRDFWTAVSYDGGLTYPVTARLDSNNWNVTSCPSSGADVYMYGDTMVSVFMNGAGGNRVYIASMDLATMQVHGARKIFQTPNNSNQNFPRLAGVGDTLGVVWKQLASGNTEVTFSHSFNGPNGVGLSIDTLTDGLDGSQVYPDIAYGAGKFHVVFEDVNTEKVYYMSASIPGLGTASPIISNNESFDLVTDNGLAWLVNKGDAASNVRVVVYNALGQRVGEYSIGRVERGERKSFAINNTGTGLFFINVESENGPQVFRYPVWR
jgi:hypothetical protein